MIPISVMWSPNCWRAKATGLKKPRTVPKPLGVISDADRRPNVILLDLMMPVMDGWEFARRLQEHVPPLNIPIVVLSAARLPNERLTVLGAQAVLAKPFDVDELLDQVARVLGGAPGGAGPWIAPL